MCKRHGNRCGVLITSNPLNHEGGVVAFYNVLLKCLGKFECDARHHTLASRMDHFHSPVKKRILYPILYVYDLLKLTLVLVTNRGLRIVQVNPSLIPVPLVRDGIVILLARLLGRKVVIVFHGWKEYVLAFLIKHASARWLFRLVYKRAALTLVLSQRFKADLIALGFSPERIEVTTTMYEAETIMPAEDRSGKRPRFLFLGRISQLKGVDELIEAARILTERGDDCEFVMVGHGDREGVVEEYARRVERYGLKDRFRFTGRLTGQDKYRVYAECDVYVFPSWTEGCPTSVLEALGAGLFVISTDVGALADVICDGINGKIVGCRDHQDLAAALAWACKNIEDVRSRRPSIQSDAKARFEAGVIADQFKNIYRGLVYD